MTGNEKLWEIYFKKLFFQNGLVFIDLFDRYHYIRYFIYSDCPWRNVCTIICVFNKFYIVYSKKIFFCYNEFFSVEHIWYFIFKSNLNMKNLGQNLNVYFNKKLISYCIIFETNKYIYRNGYVRGWWLWKWQYTKEGLSFYKFPRDKNLKQQWLIKIKQKYPVDTTHRNMSCLLLRLKSRLEKDAISAGPKLDFLPLPHHLSSTDN